MRRKLGKNLCSLFLTLTMILGLFPGMSLTAYAAPTEELLTTITAVGTSNAPTATSANVSYSTEDIATLTFSQVTPDGNGRVSYVPTWGWWGYGITLTVTPAEGYTITKCVFYDDANRTATDSEAPFVVETEEDDKTPKVNCTPILAYTSKGIKKIEVYGYATPVHTHEFTYSASGATITATCGEGCDITEGLTLTISAPTGDLTADGTKTFPATLSTGYNTTAFPGTYTITYTKNGAEFTGTPTEAGEYTASVTVGTATASVSYTVNASKDTQTITAIDVTATYGDTGVKINASTTGDGGLSYAVKSGDAVTVDSSGNLTIVKAGTAVITITATETATYAQATKDVTVTINTKDMTVSAEDVNVTVDGQPHGITVNVTDPASGATVKYGTEEGTYNLDASPTQTEVGETTVYYQVTADNYTTYTGSAKVTVSAKQTQTITASDVTATYGDTGVTINASVTTGGGALSYSVKSGDAMTVDSSGNLTIVKAGTAVITVTAAETDTYAQATKDVTVTINTKDMTVSAEDVNVTVDGQPHGITVNVTDPATGYTVKYGTTEGSYTLDTSPTQTETGETTVYYQVTADNYTTYTGSAKVTVSAKQTQTITASDVTATYGDTGVTINASVTTGGGALSYSVKSGDAVTVDSSGNLTIVKAGTAVITVTAAETATYAQATKDVTVNISKADIDADSIDVSIESWVAGEDTNTPVITGLPVGVSADNVIIMYAPEGSDQFTTDMPSTAGNYVVKVVVPESDNYKEATFTASLTIDPVVYSFIGDDGLSWIKGSSETLSFTAKRNVSDDKTFGKFTGILVDGVEVSANNYTAVSGSVVVTLSADYLNTLSVGEHTITIRFSDGADITTRFTVKASGIASPATGETISIWTLMGFACIAAAGAVISFKRWKKEEE